MEAVWHLDRDPAGNRPPAELAHMLASQRLARWAPDAAVVLATHDRLATVLEPPVPSPRPAALFRPR